MAILRGTVPDGQWPCWAPVPARLLFGTVPAFMKDRDTGIYVCRLNRNFPKVDRIVLEKSSLIPEAWAEKVKPAFETWRANRDAFTQPVEGERREKLIELFKDANLVTSFLAYKHLLETGHLSFRDVPDELLEARSQLGVVVLLHVLHWTPQAEQDHLYQRLARTIDSAKSLESLHGIATACGMELYMRAKARPDERASFNLLSRIDKRIKEQTKAGKRDAYFDAAEEEWAREKGMLAK
ncbi:MAG TPA: hypothetical protein VFE47_22505 [Tepidisphaeraceae bacterium]|nr:hypothetical protein [Tepidisphaeraceae bacterium]